MKLRGFLLGAVLALVSVLAQADVGALYNNPTYIPSLTYPQTAALPTGAQSITRVTSGYTILNVNFTGTCTALAGTIQGSTDNGTTWTTLNVYPYPTLGTAQPTASASGAIVTGLQKVNTEGFSNVKLVITALTGTTCKLSTSFSNGGFSSYF